MAALAELGFGKTMEKKLHSVGIHSVGELAAFGSRRACARLKMQYPGTCVVILYYLEAALRGVGIKQLDAATKQERKAFFGQL